MRPSVVAAPVAALGLGFGVLLAKERKVEVREAALPRTALVVGGGVIGVSTAYQLARRGVSVTLLEERDQIAQVLSWTSNCSRELLLPSRRRGYCLVHATVNLSVLAPHCPPSPAGGLLL